MVNDVLGQVGVNPAPAPCQCPNETEQDPMGPPQNRLPPHPHVCKTCLPLVCKKALAS